MQRQLTLKLTVGALALSMLGASSAPCAEPPRFPLIWQARSEPNADGTSVVRLHDPEAGVNCYVATNVLATYDRPVTISCVKVR